MTGVQHKVIGTAAGVACTYAMVKSGISMDCILVAVGSTIGCMIPDIDHDKTKIGRKRKLVTGLSKKAITTITMGGLIVTIIVLGLLITGIKDFGISIASLIFVILGILGVITTRKVIGNSKTFKWASKHRGIMHTLLVPILLMLSLNITRAPIYYYSVLGLNVGYMSHLFADMLTVRGCPILFPLLKVNIRLLRLKTKSGLCNLVAYGISILLISFTVLIFS